MAAPDITSGLERVLQSLGHHWILLQTAWQSVNRRFEKGALDERARQGVEQLIGLQSAVGLGEPQESLSLDCSVESGGVPSLQILPFNQQGQRQTELVWHAALFLPALCAEWLKFLRAQVGEALRQHLAQGWLVRELDLPPWSALAGLGVHQWQQLPSLREQKSLLLLDQTGVELGRASRGDSAGRWSEFAQLVANSPGHLLLDVTRQQEAFFIRLNYVRNPQGRWELASSETL